VSDSQRFKKFVLESVVRISKLKLAGAIGIAAILSTPSFASATDALYITPGIGTMGVSIKGSYRWSENMSVTALMSGFSYSRNLTYNGTPATAKASLFDTGLLFDYYPLGGDFRVSGGIRYSDDKVTGTVTDSGTTIGYKIQANKIQPYMGVGYSLPVANKMSLDFDLGAFYMGKPKVTANSSFSNAQISNALAKAQSDASQHTFYPVAQVGLRFKF
jgi:hypothetical protein